jgi:ribosomal protein S6--L-glutamate ligase
MAQEKMRIGCQEWCAFPELHIVSMRAKIDTGAKTSALHAEDIHVIEKSGKAYVQFLVPPFPGEVDTAKQCEMPIIDRRYITSSNSTKERRYIISTAILMGGGDSQDRVKFNRSALNEI